MTVDAQGRVHVMMRGEDGLPVYFQRDPNAAEWSRKTIPRSANGDLVAGHKGDLYIVSNGGLKRAIASNFDKIETRVSGQNAYFKDSRMGMDRNRPTQDGWISVIGQTEKRVTVVDYWIGDDDESQMEK